MDASIRSTSRESRQQSTESLKQGDFEIPQILLESNTKHWPVKSAARRTNKDLDFERKYTPGRVLQRFAQFCNSLNGRVAKLEENPVAAIFVALVGV